MPSSQGLFVLARETPGLGPCDLDKQRGLHLSNHRLDCLRWRSWALAELWQSGLETFHQKAAPNIDLFLVLRNTLHLPAADSGQSRGGAAAAWVWAWAILGLQQSSPISSHQP